MGKYKVEFGGGEGRHTNGVVDYMLVQTNKGEIYAEVEWSDEAENRDQMEEQVEIYWKLLEKVVIQANELEIDLNEIDIDWERYGTAKEYWNDFKDVSVFLKSAVKKYWK